MTDDDMNKTVMGRVSDNLPPLAEDERVEVTRDLIKIGVARRALAFVRAARARRLRRVFRVLWCLWVASGLGLEAVAIAAYRNRGATLSENVWALLDVARNAPGGAFLVAGFSMLLIGFFGWVSLHFFQRLMAEKRL